MAAGSSARVLGALLVIGPSLGVSSVPMRCIPLFALLVILAGCARNASVQSVHRHRGDDPLGSDGSPITPVQFLDLLKKTTNSFIIVLDNKRDWVLDSDVGPLLGRLDSEARCPLVVSVASSYWPIGVDGSSEGHEAALLIEGFRQGYYPPALSSDLFKPDKEELRRWYREWSKNEHTSR